MSNDEPTSKINHAEQPTKGRQPDYEAFQVLRDDKGRENWIKIGAVWESKKGYLTGDTVHGKLVLQSRDTKEALQEMRAQKQGTAPSQKQNQTPEPSP